MAGDWIKMRNCLGKAPQVIRIASELKVSKYEVIGGLFWLWVIADENSLDGIIKLGPKHLDAELGLEGFSQALAGVGWLEKIDDNSIRLSNYSEHNGKTGKRRAEEYKRSRDKRELIKSQKKQQDRMRSECGQNADGNLLEKEKEKEKEKEIDPLEGNTGNILTVESEQAEDLARVWVSQRRGVCRSEQPSKVLEEFKEALKHGLNFETAMQAMVDPERKRTEYLWQFMQRVGNKNKTVENSLEKVLARMASDPNKAPSLGVAFNGI